MNIVSLSPREKQLLERAKRAGAPVNTAVPAHKFALTVSPVTTDGVEVGILARLGEDVTALAQAQGFACELSGVVLFPIVARAAVYSKEDFVTYKRASNGYFVGRNIPFESWKRARVVGRLALAVKNFQSSLLAIPDKHLSADSKARLLDLVRAAAARASGAEVKS